MLEQRVEQKLRGSKIDTVVNRIHVAEPSARDDKVRDAAIPDTVLHPVESMEKRRLEKELMVEQGGAGVYATDVNSEFQNMTLAIRPLILFCCQDTTC